MPLWLLSNWKLLAAAVPAVILGIWLGVVKMENTNLRLQIANLKLAQAQLAADSAQVAADAEKRARDAENKAAEAARSIDEQHAKDTAAADAGRADFAVRLRNAKASARCNSLPTPADHPSLGADTASGGDGGLRSADSGNRLRNAALSLQAYAKAAQAFALSCGR